MDNADISYRKLRDVSWEEYLRCFMESFPGKRTLNHLHWLFEENPAGGNSGYGAFLGDKLIGTDSYIPINFKMGDSQVLAALNFDGMLVPEFRGKGVYKHLGRYANETMESDGFFKFSYGFGNDNLLPVKFYGQQWMLLDPTPLVVRLLRPSYIWRRMGLPFGLPCPESIIRPLGKAHVQRIGFIPEDIGSLWRDFSETFYLGVIRDRSFLNWRFAERPDTEYLYFSLRDKESRLQGFSVLRILDRPDGRMAYVMELMAGRKNFPSTAKALLQAMNAEAFAGGAELILARIMPHHPYRRAYLAQGFLPVPSRLHPGHIHFIAKAYDSSFQQIVEDRRNWYVSYADSDTI